LCSAQAKCLRVVFEAYSALLLVRVSGIHHCCKVPGSVKCQEGNTFSANSFCWFLRECFFLRALITLREERFPGGAAHAMAGMHQGGFLPFIVLPGQVGKTVIR